MKKIICLLFIIILTGCGNVSTFSYELESLQEKVISAEIVDVTRPQEDTPPGINAIISIGDDDLETMLVDLSNMKIYVTLGRPQRTEGICLKLNYENDYELICDSVIVSYDHEGNFIYHKDIYKPEGFDEFISKYNKE
ncbi:hypothetical protein [Haloplasma contractile]|uniref:Membrane lipoprotein n=1 Tax=Haloplasma contractile SSD-17B TaxID=1033810 RepID=F7Q2P7_9MOLU|nr:hypothetical protein [Haloplasma contractile]ERJ10866.1 membrane lipoprotein [Haloplasma contractile SSD-17B]